MPNCLIKYLQVNGFLEHHLQDLRQDQETYPDGDANEAMKSLLGKKWPKPHLLGQSWKVGRNKSRGCAMKAGSAKDRVPITLPSTFNCHRRPYSLRGGQR